MKANCSLEHLMSQLDMNYSSQNSEPMIFGGILLQWNYYENKNTYSSFPASLDAYFVYHRATLKPMETSSNTASCWALKKNKQKNTTLNNLVFSVLF